MYEMNHKRNKVYLKKGVYILIITTNHQNEKRKTNSHSRKQDRKE